MSSIEGSASPGCFGPLSRRALRRVFPFAVDDRLPLCEQRLKLSGPIGMLADHIGPFADVRAQIALFHSPARSSGRRTC